jgi:hypothetical protein
VDTSDPNDVISYRRGDAIVLVNARPHEVKFTVTGVGVDGLRDLLTKSTQKGGSITLPAFGAVVLERNQSRGATVGQARTPRSLSPLAGR